MCLLFVARSDSQSQEGLTPAFGTIAEATAHSQGTGNRTEAGFGYRRDYLSSRKVRKEGEGEMRSILSLSAWFNYLGHEGPK